MRRPFDHRRFRAAHQAITRQLEAGRTEEARRVLEASLPRIHAPRLRADLLTELVDSMLARGEASGLALDAYTAVLEVSDLHYRGGNWPECARTFGEAMRIGFNRILHFDDTSSPLAAAPAEYVRPLRDSAAARALRAPRGAASPSGKGKADSDRPTRVLVVTRRNANFLHEVRELLDESADLEGRYFDIAADRAVVTGLNDPATVAEEILTGSRWRADRLETGLRPDLDWADVVLLEWCTAHAALFTMIDPGDTRIVLRLHSYEAFTPWPHLVDFSRIDDLLFVSPHLRDLAVASIPALQEQNAPALHVLPLGMKLRRHARPKQDQARFNVALVGWGSVVKDPRWALEVLASLRHHDDRFRLLLIGAEFKESASAASRAYALQLRPELEELEAAGAVRRLGHTDDVSAALTDVGVIMSSSVRESFHAGLVEGVASGAVPVVRDWPFFAGRENSARTLFPDDWVVGSPEQAVERILSATASEATWREAGSAAAQHALGQWDWDVVKHRYDAFFSA